MLAGTFHLVRTIFQCTDTIPLYFLCLSEESPTEMWKTVCQHIDYAQDSERDSVSVEIYGQSLRLPSIRLSRDRAVF